MKEEINITSFECSDKELKNLLKFNNKTMKESTLIKDSIDLKRKNLIAAYYEFLYGLYSTLKEGPQAISMRILTTNCNVSAYAYQAMFNLGIVTSVKGEEDI